jgi:aryl-alcohol dehydrogenase-like predicted oxidoreductase
MRYRLLGGSGLRVWEVFLGAMTFAGGFAHGAGVDEDRRIVDAYADAGGNVVDTAVNYREGASEEIVGAVLAGRRDRFVLATKYGVSRGGDGGPQPPQEPAAVARDEPAPAAHRRHRPVLCAHLGSPDTRRGNDARPRRRRTVRHGAPRRALRHPSMGGRPGRHRGPVARLEPVVALQARYLLSRDAERDLLPAAQALGMSVAAWSPLGGGVLSGKFTRPGGTADVTRLPADSISERDHAVAQVVQDVAAKLGATPSQVALAWTCRAHG